MTSVKTRKISSEKLEKLQKEQETRNAARRKAQKKGKSLATDKSKLKTSRPSKSARKVTKKRASVR